MNSITIDADHLAKDLKPLLEYIEHAASNVKILADFKKKYPFLNTRKTCSYCLFNQESLSKPAHIRDTSGKWSDSTYLLCPRCRGHLKGYFKYSKS